jgi:hypothetical protein
VSSDGYDRMVELVAENPALDAEDLVEMTTEEGFNTDDARQGLEDAEARGDVLESDDKYWVAREGEYSVGEFDHPV